MLALRQKHLARWAFPMISAACLICAGVALLVTNVPGVLFGEFYVAMTIALPGIAILAGVGIGEFIAWILRFR